MLLLDLKAKQDLYHGNISIKNIVLFEDELKISGFKPIFVHNPEFRNWKTELVQKTSHYRLDLYMIGLIWLRFLGSRLEEIHKENISFDDFSKIINERYHDLSEDKKTNIVEKLLGVEESPNLNLDDAILLFDEYFVLESQQMREIQRTGSNKIKNDTLNRNSISDVGRGSYFNSRDSYDQENNLFTRNINDSAIDNMTFKEEFPNLNEDDNLKAENDFTIRDDHTFVHKDTITNRNMHDSLAPINNRRHTDNLISTGELVPIQITSTSSERRVGETKKVSVADLGIKIDNYGSLPNDFDMKKNSNSDGSSKFIEQNNFEGMNKDFSKKKLSEFINEDELKGKSNKKDSVIQAKPSDSKSHSRNSSKTN